MLQFLIENTCIINDSEEEKDLILKGHAAFVGVVIKKKKLLKCKIT